MILTKQFGPGMTPFAHGHTHTHQLLSPPGAQWCARTRRLQLHIIKPVLITTPVTRRTVTSTEHGIERYLFESRLKVFQMVISDTLAAKWCGMVCPSSRSRKWPKNLDTIQNDLKGVLGIQKMWVKSDPNHLPTIYDCWSF